MGEAMSVKDLNPSAMESPVKSTKELSPAELQALHQELRDVQARLDMAQQTMDQGDRLLGRMEEVAELMRQYTKETTGSDRITVGEALPRLEALVARSEKAADATEQAFEQRRVSVEVEGRVVRNHSIGFGLLFMAVASFFLVVAITDIFWFYPAMAMILLYTIAEERFGLNMPAGGIHE